MNPRRLHARIGQFALGVGAVVAFLCFLTWVMFGLWDRAVEWARYLMEVLS